MMVCLLSSSGVCSGFVTNDRIRLMFPSLKLEFHPKQKSLNFLPCCVSVSSCWTSSWLCCWAVSALTTCRLQTTMERWTTCRSPSTGSPEAWPGAADRYRTVLILLKSLPGHTAAERKRLMLRPVVSVCAMQVVDIFNGNLKRRRQKRKEAKAMMKLKRLSTVHTEANGAVIGNTLTHTRWQFPSISVFS